MGNQRKSKILDECAAVATWYYPKLQTLISTHEQKGRHQSSIVNNKHAMATSYCRVEVSLASLLTPYASI